MSVSVYQAPLGFLDSHTPTGGGIGMIAIGAGGLDVAVAMGGGAYYITYPKIVKVNLTGKLPS